MNNFIAFLLLTTACTLVHGIQVYENVTNDTTTATTKLAIVPTPINQNDVADKDSVTSNVTKSTEDVKGPVMINNSSVAVMIQEKNSRKKQDDSSGDRTNRNNFDQQQKTSSNVKHEKFVPSPEISLSGIPEPTMTQSNRDNFYPTNQYYRPVKHSVHFHSSAPITSNWKHSEDLHSLPKHFPKFEEEIEQLKENEKIMWPPPTYESGKWFFMPDKYRTEVTEKPKQSGNGKWKWVSDDDEPDKPSVPYSYNPSDYAIPTVPPKEFSYTFEIPSTDSTPYSFDSIKYDGINQQSTIEPISPSTTLSTSDSEWDSPFTFSNGKLKHKNKDKGKEANISPWKKILHVLTAAIPIGLLISALTPQVIYVDPNSTSSISPSNSLSLLSTTKHRSLDREAIQMPDPSEILENQFGRKLLSNPLMDFLNVLRDNGNRMEQSDSCDDRNFCEISRSGADSNANVLNKMLWKIANETPELQARKSGLKHIFEAIRDNNCSIFECKKHETNYHRQNYRKN